MTRGMLRHVPGLALLAGLVGGAVAAGCATSQAPPTQLEAPGSSGAGASADSGVPSGTAGTSGTAGGSSESPTPVVQGLSVFQNSCTSQGPTVAWSPVRRISRVEYNNMVRDLLQDTTKPATAFVEETALAQGVNFEANTYTTVSTLIGQQYMQTAETLAGAAASSQNTLNNLLSACSSKDDACAQKFIQTWANRALRGQLDSAEAASLLQLYQDVKTQFDFATGIQAVIAAVLESPRFLYVLEFGDGSASSGTMPLSPYEVAGRLAFYLWRTVPDDNLMQLAQQGNLGTAQQVMAQAQAMLADPKAEGATADFTTEWMQLESAALIAKDAQFTKWNANVASELKAEATTTYSQMVLAEGASFTDVMTSPETYMSPDLQQSFYAGEAMASGNPVNTNGGQVTKATLAHKTGILTNAAVLATQSHTTLPSAILRGKLVREQVLCDIIPAPPPGIPSAPTSAPEGGLTTRQLLSSHLQRGTSCPVCHTFMDPIGFGFMAFDASGAWQSADLNGFTLQQNPGAGPIDASGQFNPMSTGELSATFSDAAGMATTIAASQQAQQCFALQQFRYALSRIENTADTCSIQQAFSAYTSNQLNIQKLMVAITGTDAFRYRAAGGAGSSCQ